MTTVYQHSTLAALMAGLMGGTTTVADLLTHGDTGIGTLAGVNGEVIILDGDVYQAESSGKVNHITDHAGTTMPFGTVHFSTDTAKPLTVAPTDFAGLADLAQQEDFLNNFAALQLHGTFKHVLVRIAPKSEAPYPGLLEVAQKQPTFEAHDIQGTLVGYFAPALYEGAVAAGWHLHFISDDRQFAGHLLATETETLTGTLTTFSDFNLHLPVDDADFRQHTLDLNGLNQGIQAAEGH